MTCSYTHFTFQQSSFLINILLTLICSLHPKPIIMAFDPNANYLFSI